MFKPRHNAIVAVFALASTVVGCGFQPGPGTPVATWPTEPERLAAAVPIAPDALMTCGGERAFEADALKQAPGAEHERGPLFDALRVAFGQFGDAFPDARRLEWVLADQDDQAALFLAKVQVGAPEWLAVEAEVDTDTGEWIPTTMSQCDPHVRLSPEFGPAIWALYPAYPAPGRDSAEINVLVWEETCSSGSPTTDRMSPPVIVFSEAAVAITIGVRPLEGFQGCPQPPGTPAIVKLPQPLGDHQILDGGRVPPADPSPP